MAREAGRNMQEMAERGGGGVGWSFSVWLNFILSLGNGDSF